VLSNIIDIEVTENSTPCCGSLIAAVALWVPTAVHVLQQAATGFRESHLDGLSALLALEAGMQLDTKQAVHHRGVWLRWVLQNHTKEQFRKTVFQAPSSMGITA